MSAVYRVHPHLRCCLLCRSDQKRLGRPQGLSLFGGPHRQLRRYRPCGKTWQIHLTGLCDHESGGSPTCWPTSSSVNLNQGHRQRYKVRNGARVFPATEEPNGEAAAALVDQEVDDYMDLDLGARPGVVPASRGGERPREAPSKGTGEVLMGRRITEEPIPLKEVQDEERKVVIQGQVIALDVREMRPGRKLLTFDVTDLTDSIHGSVGKRRGSKLQASRWGIGCACAAGPV